MPCMSAVQRLADDSATSAFLSMRPASTEGAEARAELASGPRAAAALEWRGSPWQRAQFLTIADRSGKT